MPLTLVKYLVGSGAGSRRECAALIIAGRVSVNGEAVTNLTQPIKASDRVAIGHTGLTAGSGKALYLLDNTPSGYLAPGRDDRGRRTVLDLVPEALRIPGLVPAGRLDLRSSGLMLLTNDGELVNRVTHPRYGVRKEYHVLVDHPLGQGDARKLVSGVDLPEGRARAVAVRRLPDIGEPNRYSITMVEGKKREVRQLLAAVGRRVTQLERVKLGNLDLGGLAKGRVRELTPRELSGLRSVSEPPKNSAHRAESGARGRAARPVRGPARPRPGPRRGRASAA
jgi:pseudouridine synthase